MILQNRFLLITILAVSILCMAGTGDQVKNVLIIGDSISIGYTPLVEKALAPGVAVAHNPGNGGSTVRGVENIEKWLDNRKWDVILFNFGLHDLVYKDQQNKYDVLNGKISVSLDQYRKNLELIIAKLKETKASLIFVSTTVVPENSPGRKVEDPAKYNEVAIEVMKKHEITVVDLYATSLTVHPQNSKPGNVHYSPEGYELLAKQIIKEINSALKR